jgi:transcriptional regulator with XRE-family HTH domain
VPATPSAADTTGTTEPEGAIAGALLREIRRRLGFHQDRMAELLSLDINTYRSYEHGRRSLGKVTAQRLRALTRGLIRIGAEEQIVDLLTTAVDVDTHIGEILTNTGRPEDHPLASFVQTRTWHDLLAWGIAGSTPRALSGTTGAVAPRMSVPVRNALLERLREAAEQTGDSTDLTSTLLRRQVYFVASWDRSGPGRDWLGRMERRELVRLRKVDGWTPSWVAGRSLAVAKAVSGDPEQLRHFIANQLADDGQEVANLNYWANWAGEDTRSAPSDAFMNTPDLGAWRGTSLLRQLADGLTPTNPYIDLTVHTVKALIFRRGWLLDDDPALKRKIAERIQLLHDQPQSLSDQARRELDEMTFGIQMIMRRHP